MFDLARCNFSTATDLADALVEEAGLSFRQAHHVVGAVVRKALDRGLSADQITPDMVSEAASEMLGRTVSVPADTVKRSVDPRAAVTGRGGTGGPAPDEVRRMADGARQKLAADRQWIAGTRNRIDEAKARLRSTVEQIAAC